MIKSFLLAFSMYLTLPMAAMPVLADHTPEHTVCQQVEQVDANCGEDRLFGRDGLVTKIVQTLVFIVGAVSVLMIVIGAINFTTSAGSPERTKSARQTILYAIIGIVVAIAAQGIVRFVLFRIGQ